jgi:hypothetical protein
MQDRPYDLAVTLRLAAETALIRQLTLFSCQGSQLMAACYSSSDAAYHGSTSAMLQAAVGELLGAVRARLQDKQDFCIWYYSERERDLVERAASDAAGADDYWSRYVEKLAAHARIAPETARNQQAE